MMAEHLHGPFVLDVGLPTAKSLEDGDIVIEGYAADFEIDRQNEKFLPQAFDAAIAKANEGTIPLLLEHNNNQPLGTVEELKCDDRGLWMRGRIAAKAVSDAWDGAKGKIELIRRGMMKGLSVRGHSWGRMTPSGPEIGHIDLAEISITPVPVQPGALFAVTQKSLEYAANPASHPDIAFAAQGFSEVMQQYSREEVEEAVNAFYKGKIKDLKGQLKFLNNALDQS
jgi:HK97 family phage prohead protease